MPIHQTLSEDLNPRRHLAGPLAAVPGQPPTSATRFALVPPDAPIATIDELQDIDDDSDDLDPVARFFASLISDVLSTATAAAPRSTPLVLQTRLFVAQCRWLC
jgi:hypothetical protein